MITSLTAEQQAAIVLAEDWFRNVDVRDPVFRLFGYAGTGKTTVLETLVNRIGLDNSQVMYISPTNRAVSVMRSKGLNASTIHKAFYTLRGTDEKETNALVEEADSIRYRLEQREGNPVILNRRLREIEAKLSGASRRESLYFLFRGTAAVDRSIQIIVCDEASMVTNAIFTDLASLGLPIIFIGDPGQLPSPDRETQKNPLVFTARSADVMLTDVQRQSSESSILTLAALARQGDTIFDEYYDERGVGVERGTHPHLADRLFEAIGGDPLYFDQIICGTHKTRSAVNAMCSARLGLGKLPSGMTGEKLTVTKNFWDSPEPIINGSQITVSSDRWNGPSISAPGVDHKIDTPVVVETVDGVTAGYQGIPLLKRPFEDPLGRDKIRNERERFPSLKCLNADWGWAITAHSSQGSQWDRVCVIDDWNYPGRNEWLYTAITRARSELLIIHCGP